MKRFNLLFDSWIPVRTRQGGNRPPIKAYEIVQKDLIGLDAPRADFNAALMQFLIGLLQTVIAPKNPREWRMLFNKPPSEHELKDKFGSIKEAFYLDGDGYRFMQDALAKDIGKHRPIEEIIFGAPGGSGKDKNRDHFIKQNDISGLCYSCAASALLTANIFAEDGGRGYFQSMRGNGFISTLVQLDENLHEVSLWKNIWLNILEGSAKLKKSFYWTKELPEKSLTDSLKKTNKEIKTKKIAKRNTKNTLEKEKIDKKIRELEKRMEKNKHKIDSLTSGKHIRPENNELQVYWAWMRRFLLDIEKPIHGQCSLCGIQDRLSMNFYKASKGYKYPKEEWQNRHPFSPSIKYQRAQYDKNTLKYKDKMLSIEMTQNGLPYTYWQDFFVQTENRAPATVVNRHLKENISEKQLILWSFGFAMDSNSPICWYESKTPLYLIKDKAKRRVFELETQVSHTLKGIDSDITWSSTSK